MPGARETLLHLQKQNIPFILVTNGGGTHESVRVRDLSQKLDVPLDVNMFVQSHTPFAALASQDKDGAREAGGLKEDPVLVVGGEGDNCRLVAEQ